MPLRPPIGWAARPLLPLPMGRTARGCGATGSARADRRGARPGSVPVQRPVPGKESAMTAPQRRLSRTRLPAGKQRQPSRKPPPLGTDPALTVPTGGGEPLPLTYWDVWFALVAASDCGGDLGRLAERLRDDQTVLSLGRDAAERKRSHL